LKTDRLNRWLLVNCLQSQSVVEACLITLHVGKLYSESNRGRRLSDVEVENSIANCRGSSQTQTDDHNEIRSQTLHYITTELTAWIS